MKVCVIGCTGFIGSYVSKNLSLSGHDVIGVCRKFPKRKKNFKRNLFYKVIEGDITNLDTIKNLLKLKFSTLIYTISLNHQDSNKDLINAMTTNTLPVLELCHHLTKRKNKIKFIYFSTTQVYGEYSKRRTMDEESKTICNTPYALTHLISENIIKTFSKNKNFQSISIRLSNSYGFSVINKKNSWLYAINELCKSSILNSKIKLLSDGKVLRDFIHISDVYSALIKIIQKKRDLPETINIVSGQFVSMLEIALLIRENSKKFNVIPSLYIKDRVLKDKQINEKIKSLKKISKSKISDQLMRKLKIFNSVNLNNGIYLTLEGINRNKKSLLH
jgi:nucleoside-diphosphate-sugar epimerase